MLKIGYFFFYISLFVNLVFAEDNISLTKFLETSKSKEELKRITKSEELKGKVRLLHLGMNSFKIREDIIKNAKKYIFISVPYWRNNPGGWHFLKVLEEAKRKNPNLELRLILGFAGSAMFSKFLPSRLFKRIKKVFDGNVFLWNPPYWFRSFSFNVLKYRLHDKMLIVDGKKMIIGGLNVGVKYFDGGKASYGWHDSDLLISGEPVKAASLIFIKNWEFSKYLRTKKYFPPFKKKWIPLLQDYYYKNKYYWSFKVANFSGQKPFYGKKCVYFPLPSYLKKAFYFPEYSQNDNDVPIRLIFDNPFVDCQSVKPYKPYSKTQNTVNYLLKNCKKRVKMFIPYFTANTYLIEQLQKAARRGVKVEILTNSLASLDIDRIYFGSLGHYLPLIRAGVKIYEWQGHKRLKEEAAIFKGRIKHWPGNTLHTKALVFDGEVLMLGSHNLNVRSDHYNTEIMALIKDRKVSLAVEKIFNRDLEPYQIRTFRNDVINSYYISLVREIDENAYKRLIKKYRREVKFYSWLKKIL